MRRALRAVFGFGPLFAWDALMLALSAKRELDAATMAQLSEYARDGAR